MNNDTRLLIFDIETDGLDLDEITTIYTLSIWDSKNNSYHSYDLEDVEEGIKYLHEARIIGGHNIIGYDIDVIKKFYPWFTYDKAIDTLVWARLIYTNLMNDDAPLVQSKKLPKELRGRHSLKAWGYRLGLLKGDFGENTDWSEFSQEMSDYCLQDVKVTKVLYDHLASKKINKEAVGLEHRVAEIIHRQELNGFPFDKKQAEKLFEKLIDLREEMYPKLLETFGSWWKKKGDVKTSKVNRKDLGYIKGGVYQKIELVEFNPNSRAHIAKRLKDIYDWEPKEFTPTGLPRINEDILKDLPYPEAEMLVKYMTISKRISQLSDGKSAWLKHVEKDGRIRGSVITNGAVTGRMTHMSPNISQVPANNAPYGEECRSLFQAREGWKLLGVDASGLELRCLAHYMAKYDNGKYGKIILEGDIHSENQKAAGLDTRNNAKTFIYAFLYGAGDAKIGAIVNGSKREGRKLKDKFLRKTPALASLKNDVEKVVNVQGGLFGLDGRPLHVRSTYASLNTLLQSAGAIVMKKALVLFVDLMESNGYPEGENWELVANIHDEFQVEFNQEEIPEEEIKRISVKSIVDGGEHYNFRCPLDGVAQVGDNWSQTH
jgi:DNA polymerase I-like protein with 3'-5' exonuclease and polymerase domains